MSNIVDLEERRRLGKLGSAEGWAFNTIVLMIRALPIEILIDALCAARDADDLHKLVIEVNLALAVDDDD